MIIITDFMSRLGNLSALKDFISFLATVKGDLSNITAPPFILAPQSLTEFPAYWSERPRLFSAAANEPSPERRMLYVLEIYLSSLQRQYYIGQPVSAGTKKPLNPFLGELFFCECRDPEGKSTVKVICEQVSHHPPTTACLIEDEKNGVRAEAYSTQHTALSGTSIVVRQSGHAVFTIDKYNESYLLPFPDVYAKSVLTGSPYPELQGTYKIFSTSGLTAEINFSDKTRKILSGGDRNMFSASIYRTNDKSKKSFYNLSGSWSDAWEVKDAKGKQRYTYDLSDSKNKPATMILLPPEKQSPWESRRAWKDVAEPLRAGDFSKAQNAKSKIENAQRELRKKEKAEGKTWESAFFRRVDDDEEEGKLGELLEMVGKDEDCKTILGSEGIWRFDAAKAKAWNEGRSSWPKTPFG